MALGPRRGIDNVVPVKVPSKSNGAASPESSIYELIPAGQLLGAQTPPEYIVAGLLESNVATGFVGPPESGKSLLAINISACVATGSDFHGRVTKKGLVVYLAGEGYFGIARRLQAIEKRYAYGLARAPLMVAKSRAALIDPIEVLRVRDAIKQAEQDFEAHLELLVIDTLSRFIAPGDESKAMDMGAYLDAVDALRGSATSITLHHPGHGEATRGRGSSNWRGGLDAEFSIANANDIVTLTTQKMKDGERPAPMSFRIEQTPTMSTKKDGFAVMSVVLAPTDVLVATNKLSGKNQKNLLTELEKRQSQETSPIVWTERDLRAIARSLDMSKSSAITAVLGLRQFGYFTETIGGSKLSRPPDEGTEVRKGYGSTDSVRDVGYGNAPVSLETVLPYRPAYPDDPIGRKS